MRWSKTLQIVGAHAEGEVGRVITGGVLDIPGATMLDKLNHLKSGENELAQFSLFEPRGSATMSANILMAPTRPDADAAFIPLQPSGPQAMSGSNAMCVTTVLLETGMLPMQEPVTEVNLDTPAGLIKATATCADGKCQRVSLDFSPCFVEHLDHPVTLDGLGTIAVDVAFGGCYFALVNIKDTGLALTPENARQLVDLGSRLHKAVNEQIKVQHPEVQGFNQIDFLLFCDQTPTCIRNGNVMFPGRFDRSPCGTGTAARLAVMHARRQLKTGQKIESRSIIDSVFQAEVAGVTKVAGRDAVLPRISGRAWIFSQAILGVDPSDPYPLGFTLSDTWGSGL